MIVMIIFLSFFVTLCFASVTRIPFTIRGDESLRMTAWTREDTPFELVVTSNSYSESVRRCGETIHLSTTTNTPIARSSTALSDGSGATRYSSTSDVFGPD